MKLFKFDEIEKVTVNEDFDDSYYSDDIDNALSRGFDPNYPVVLDEDGSIIDGNHRFTAFFAAGRINEVYFAIVKFEDYTSLAGSFIGTEDEKRFHKDSDFFYQQIQTIALN